MNRYQLVHETGSVCNYVVIYNKNYTVGCKLSYMFSYWNGKYAELAINSYVLL